MDAYEAVLTKLDIRRFSSKKVLADVKLKILEAARATGTRLNSQHWRFILVQEPSRLMQLAKDSNTGQWVEDAAFAVIVVTDSSHLDHSLDAGRALQNMQVAAWNYGVASGLYTGVREDAMRRNFKIPKGSHIATIVVFGYPAMKITGTRKNRKPLSEVAFLEEYGHPIEPKTLS